MTVPNENDDGGASAAIDIVSGVTLAILSMIALVWLIPANVGGVSDGSDVSPAFFPSLSALVILVLSLAMVAHRFLRGSPRHGWATGRQILAETGAVLIFALAVGTLVPVAGYMPTTILVILVGGFIAGYRRWWALILLAVLFPIVVRLGAWTIFTVELP